MSAVRRAAPGVAMGRVACVVLAAALLGACGDEQVEIRSWMDAQRQAMPTIKDRIPAPKSFEPFRYESAGLVDPFSNSRLAAKSALPAQGGGPRPDLERRREALEGFPLDTIRMVGHMSNGRASFALLQVENMVYQARVGNYAGQNLGKITRVTETEVQLKEMVRDAAGDWTERDTALRLQENTK